MRRTRLHRIGEGLLVVVSLCVVFFCTPVRSQDPSSEEPAEVTVDDVLQEASEEAAAEESTSAVGTPEEGAMTAEEAAPEDDSEPGDRVLEEDESEGEDSLDEGGAYDGIRVGDVTLRGTFDQRYRFRKSGARVDQDVYGYMSLSAEYMAQTKEELETFSKLALNFQGSYNYDIDSFSKPRSPESGVYSPFYDTSNTFGDRWVGYLYELNLQAKDLFVFDDVKLGRQTLYREETMVFDGAFFRTKRWNTLALDVYGGVPEHFYESSRSGDVMAGATLESRPTRGLSVGVDYTYIRDQRQDLQPYGVDETVTNHLYRAFGQYNFLREWTVAASASFTGSRDRRQTFDVRYLSDDIGLLGHFRFTRQNGIVELQSNELSPYFFVMGEYSPYYQFQLDLHQPFLDHYGVGGGFNIRQLEESSDTSTFNHSFNNFYVSLDAVDLWPGMRLLLRGDAWDAHQGDEIFTGGIEFEQKVWITRVRLGTNYSLYKFDVFTGEERNRDRVYYIKVAWKVSDNVAFDTEYQYEKDSETEYHVALGGIRIWF